MYHLGAVPAEFTLIHGRFGQPEKNPPERQAEIPGIFLTPRVDTIAVVR